MKLNRLLIVEDSKVSNNLIKKKVSKYFKEIDQAYSLNEAENFLNSKEYDLIILDMHLPDGEGIELVEAISSFMNAKIIVLTSETDISLREELFKYGILDYIIKDANFSYSLEEIIKLLEHLAQKEKNKVLVIDDSKFICNRIKKILTPRGYEVEFIYNGFSAFKKVLSKEYNLIILDMELPDIHGLEILKRLRQIPELHHIPIIVLSGTSSPEIVRDILKNGANDYIQKPFVIEEFVLKVDLWIDYYEKEKELVKKTKELEEINKTLEKKVEEEIKKRREKEKFLLLQDRYIQMGEIMAMIAHQWKQPLNVLSLSTGLLKTVCPSEQKEILENMEKSIDYMAKTIDDFKNFFTPQKEKVKTNWEKIFKKTYEIIKPDLKAVKVELDIKRVENFYAYENELMQVIMNILKNAKEAIVSKKIEGKIEVLIDGRKIEIKDNAGGIPNAIKDKIFEPYFSTKGLKGTGLGLYLSKYIVEERCNGKISVENDKEGAKFIIEI